MKLKSLCRTYFGGFQKGYRAGLKVFPTFSDFVGLAVVLIDLQAGTGTKGAIAGAAAGYANELKRLD